MTQEKTSNRCQGHCCHIISLPVGPDVLRMVRRRYNKYQRTGKWPREAGNDNAPAYRISDGDIETTRMLKWVRFGKADLQGCRSLLPREGGWVDGSRHEYTCKHFDGTNCTNYEGRPNMCRDYPAGYKGAFNNPCDRAACASTDHKYPRCYGNETWPPPTKPPPGYVPLESTALGARKA